MHRFFLASGSWLLAVFGHKLDQMTVVHISKCQTVFGGLFPFFKNRSNISYEISQIFTRNLHVFLPMHMLTYVYSTKTLWKVHRFMD